ncbi:hypothetical protein SAMN05192553_101195 [Cyclobacterium xiamenense]|uniref:Two component regulator propeller n=1 Tax=Cyclobacterium xiamenense TaxID=1297121 RepID=A0A1H6TI27_9BACT|nr:hypothetical protein [Cyclobacterium xiamenense]SEI76797.1 hypothetical protein SAMN05192553_101195 [Cyclobacterium xiamenense]
MPSNPISSLLFFSFLLAALPGLAQDIQLSGERWQLDLSEASRISVDRNGAIFVSDRSGYLRQFDAGGDSLNIYAPAISTELNQLEAYWTVNLFLFSAGQQVIEILDRFLNPLSRNSMADLGFGGYISQATLGNNHGLWLYDETDLSLKKIDFSTGQLLQEQPLNILLPNSSLQVLQLLERKNILFLQIVDEGMYLFDNQANLIKKLPLAGSIPAFVDNEHTYHLETQRLVRTNFLNGDRSSLALPALPPIIGLALTKNQILLLTSSKLYAYDRPDNY